MPSPTYVSDTSTAWNKAGNSVTTRNTASMSVQTGDVLVGAMLGEDQTLTGTLTASGGGLTWTQQQDVNVASFCRAVVSTTAATSTTSFANTVTRGNNTGDSNAFGIDVFVFRGSNGIGASNKNNGTGAASVSLTTLQANSAVVVLLADWNAIDGASRAWLAVNGTTPTAGNGFERQYDLEAGTYTVYVAYYPDVGAAGAKTFGLSAPTGQEFAIVALEVTGSASGPSPGPLFFGRKQVFVNDVILQA